MKYGSNLSDVELLNLLLNRLLDDLNSAGTQGADYQPRLLTTDARERLLKHEWPGNVRELQNTLQRLVFLSENAALRAADVEAALLPTVRPSQEPDILSRPLGEDFSLKDIQAEVIRHYMRGALLASGNRISQAAKLVGTSRQNFSNWIREHGIELMRD